MAIGDEIAQTAKRFAAEQRVVRRIVTHAIESGLSVSVNNGGDDDEIKNSVSVFDVLNETCVCDEETLTFRDADGKFVGSVCLVYGNADDGSEVVSDYSTSLDAIPGFTSLLWE